MAAKLAQGAGDFASITWAPAGVPGVGDTADSNGFAVTITSNVTCDALVGTNAGAGGFTCSTAGVVITANVTATVRTVLTVSNASGTVTVTGNLTGGSTVNNPRAISKSGFGLLVINGNVTGGSAGSSYALEAGTNSPLVTINGNVFGGSSAGAGGVYMALTVTLTVNGDVTGAVAPGINNAGPATVTVSGTVTGGSAAGAYGISNTSTGTVTVNTAVVGSATAAAHGIYQTGAAIITVNGTVTGGGVANCYGIVLSNGAAIVTGTITGGTALACMGIWSTLNAAVHAQGDVVAGSGVSAHGIRNEAAGLVTVRGTITDNPLPPSFGVRQIAGAVTYNNIVYAVATGNWSAGATWSTGAVPGATTQVDSNGYTVTIDQDVTVVGLFGSAPAAGGFSCSTARTITADVRATVRTCLTLSNGAGVTVAVVGAVRGGCTGSAILGLTHATAGAVTVTGDIYGGPAQYSYGVNNGGTATITITGNCTGGTLGQAVQNGSSGTVEIAGNAVGGGFMAVNNASTGVMTITGQAIGGGAAGAYGAQNAAGGSLTVTTAVGNSFGPGGLTTSAAGVYGSNTAGAITRVYRAISGPYGQAACAGAVTMVADTRNYSTWQKSDSTGLRALVGPTWPVQPWYQAPSGATCQAAYDAVGANDLADSYTDESGAGHNAAPGVAPTWTDDVGWGMDGATTYLTTGVAPSDGWSMLVRLAGATGGGVVVGSRTSGDTGMFLQTNYGVSGFVGYRFGNTLLVAPAFVAGAIGMAGKSAFRNGVPDGTIPAGSGTTAYGAFIGALNNAGVAATFWQGTIASVAIYSATLTQNDVEIIVVEMARLPRAAAGAVYISPGMFAAMGGVRIRPLIGGVG